MTFDEALENYRQIRTELRELQGTIDKAVKEHQKLGKEIERMKKTYRSKRMDLVDAQNALVPELQKEVKNSPTYEPPEIQKYKVKDESQDNSVRSTPLQEDNAV